MSKNEICYIIAENCCFIKRRFLLIYDKRILKIWGSLWKIFEEVFL